MERSLALPKSETLMWWVQCEGSEVFFSSQKDPKQASMKNEFMNSLQKMICPGHGKVTGRAV